MRRGRSAPTPPQGMVMVRGWGWGLALALSVAVGPRGADFVHVCLSFPCFLLVFRGWGLALALSVVVGPRGADFVHVCLYFACFCLFFGLGGAVPRPLCGCGPLWVLILFILLVFGSIVWAGGGFALAPSVVVGPFGC